MTLDDARMAIIATLKKVQDVSGLPCPNLIGAEIPKQVLEQFDSTVWPVATSWIASELGIKIQNDVHVFGGKNGGPLLTINESAALIVATCNEIEENFAEAAE